MHSVSVAGVVRRGDGRILCIRRRDNGAWQIPGGVLEPGETIREGLRREVLEETGATVEPLRLTGIYQNLPVGVIALVFLCRPVDDQVADRTPEAAETAWLTPDEVRQRSEQAFAVRVLDAIEPEPGSSDQVRVRTHDGHVLLPDYPYEGRWR